MGVFNPRNSATTTLACLAALTVPFTAACDSNSPLPTPPLTENQRLATIKDMGNGILVLPKKDFADSISTFRKNNPHIEIVTMTDGPFTTYTDPDIMKGAAGPINVILVTRYLEESKKTNTDKTSINLHEHGIKILGKGSYLFPTEDFAINLAAFNNGANGNVTNISYGYYHSFPNPHGKGYLSKPENFFVMTDQR